MSKNALPLRAILVLLVVCFVWAANAILLRYAIGLHHLPPFTLAAGRFLVAALCLFPLLRTPVENRGRILLAGSLMGAGHFGFLMLGYARADAATSAIILQLGVPVTALLSMALAMEAWSIKRLIFILTATIAVIIAIGGSGANASLSGILCIIAASLSLSTGSVVLKSVGKAPALVLQAWTSTISTIILCLLALIFEPDGLSELAEQPVLSAITIVIPALIVTVFAHTLYYHTIRLYEVSVVASMTLMFPIMTMAMGVAILGEILTPTFTFGAVLAIVSVFALVRFTGQVRPPKRTFFPRKWNDLA